MSYVIFSATKSCLLDGYVMNRLPTSQLIDIFFYFHSSLLVLLSTFMYKLWCEKMFSSFFGAFILKNIIADWFCKWSTVFFFKAVFCIWFYTSHSYQSYMKHSPFLCQHLLLHILLSTVILVSMWNASLLFWFVFLDDLWC